MRKGNVVEDEGVSWAVMQNLLAAVLLVGVFGWWFFVGAPARMERRRQEARQQLGLDTIQEDIANAEAEREIILQVGPVHTPTPQATPTPIQIVVAAVTATPLPSATRENPAPFAPTSQVVGVYEATAAAANPVQAWTSPGIASASKYCLGCEVYPVQVRITHYWPPNGETNCYSFVDGYCESALFSELRWENFIGLAAACPFDWPLGTWVEIPGVGAYNCLDRGTMACFEGVCEVDILVADLGPFDGGIFDANVYITWK